MPEPPARLWLNQARSDFLAASRVLNLSEEETCCQAIAKYQQVVEKSVKAVASAIRGVGIRSVSTGYSQEVEKIIKALVLPHRGIGPTDIDRQIRNLLNDSRRAEIRTLCALAPKRPGPGELARRNTEYPFQKSDNSWMAPYEAGAFQRAEVNRFRGLADRVIEGTARIVSALERISRPTS